MKVFIGICNSQDRVPSSFFWSMMGFQATTGCVMSAMRSMHPWDIVRNNQLIHKFLNSDFDIFVKMDVDQQYPENYFDTMVPLVDKYKVVGPLIYDRWMGSKFMPLAFKAHDYPKLGMFDLNGNKGVIEIPYTHTNNFYAREVLEKIYPPWYEAHLRPDGLDRANHVDFTFLDKIKNAGYPIYCHTGVVVKHLAEIGVDNEVHELFNR